MDIRLKHLKLGLKRFLDKLYLRPRRILDWPYFDSALDRLGKYSSKFETVIDVGASNGQWSVTLDYFFQNKCFLLFEANQIHEVCLRKLCDAREKWDYCLKAAGDREGQLFFDDSDPFGGHLSATPLSPKYRPFPVTTIDKEVKERSLVPPYLIKLDTHGVEVPILTGAQITLNNTEVVIIECYNFASAPPCLPFWDMCKWMDGKGFRPIDIFDPVYRSGDRALWQIDIVFLRKNAKEFSSNRWKLDRF